MPGEGVYCATKWANVGLTELVREELRGAGVHFLAGVLRPVPTPLAAGMRARRGIPIVPSETVAEAIVDALERPRFEVWVPRSLRWSATAGSLMPRLLREALQRVAGMHKVATDIDCAEREAYEREVFGHVAQSS